MRNHILLALCMFCFGIIVKAQISTVLPSSTSIAQTSVANTKNYNAFNNPANLGFINTPEFGFQFENKFFINELSTKSLYFAISTSHLNTGISFSHFGYSLYHEILIGASFAKNYGDRFSLGTEFSYYTAFSYASNTYHGTIIPQVGLVTKLCSVFSIGFSTFNPFQSNIKYEFTLKRIPSIFSLGTEYLFSPEFVWRTQIDKEISSNYRFASGLEYAMLDNVNVKLGAYGSDFLVPCIGMGLKVRTFYLDMNCELHPLLGLNTFLSVKYKILKTK